MNEFYYKTAISLKKFESPLKCEAILAKIFSLKDVLKSQHTN